MARILTLLRDALPGGVPLELIIKADKLPSCRQNQYRYLLQALQQSPHIDWQAYTENYTDVKNAGVNPAEHFLEYGIFEGRKLFVKSIYRLRGENENGCDIKISIIVPNYNNAIFLPKCLDSLANQTLKDIEIIVIDDYSNDHSIQIINEYVAMDTRFRAITFNENKGTHIARKTGVEVARGRYIMFVDPDDFLELHACERAYLEISKGYDVVIFNMNFIFHGNYQKNQIDIEKKFHNQLPAGSYSNTEILEYTFMQSGVSWNLINKIFDRFLAQHAFEELANEYFVMAEDMYAFLVLVLHARKIGKIDDILYNYTRGNGISSETSKNKIISDLNIRNAVLPYITKYCNDHNLNTERRAIKNFLFDYSIYILPLLQPKKLANFLHTLFDQFGLLYSCIGIMRKYFYNKSEIIQLFSHYSVSYIPKTAGKIGILVWEHSRKQYVIETAALYSQLNNSEIYSIIISENASHEFPEDAHAAYVNGHGYEPEQCSRHLTDLYNVVTQAKIDTIIFPDVFESIMFWDIILLHALNVSVICLYPSVYGFDRDMRGAKLHHSELLQILHCISHILCADPASTLYLRSHAIEARYVAWDINSDNVCDFLRGSMWENNKCMQARQFQNAIRAIAASA